MAKQDNFWFLTAKTFISFLWDRFLWNLRLIFQKRCRKTLWSDTWMVTPAVHLETCPDLKSDEFFKAFNEFWLSSTSAPTSFRRNWKNLPCGAPEDWKKLLATDKDKNCKSLTVANKTWNFSPPYGLHFGGVQKCLIRSAKRTLRFIIRSRKLSFDTFVTIMVETE